MKNKLVIIVASALISGALTSCLSKVSTKMVRKQEVSTTTKAKNLLDKAWSAQGLDKLSNFSVYEVEATDIWRGFLGKVGKMWPENESQIKLKFNIGSFDGNVEFLDGKEKGLISGVQSQQFYTLDDKGVATFPKKPNEKTIFGINAYQYFFELVDRLKSAPILEYAGETTMNGKTYDMVFATWDKIKVHKKHDQYNLWINRETGVAEFCEFTIHDPYLLGGSALAGSIEFADFKTVDGISIPFTQYVYAGSPKENKEKFLHRLSVSSFKFDSFNESDLYPKGDLKKFGDSK